MFLAGKAWRQRHSYKASDCKIYTLTKGEDPECWNIHPIRKVCKSSDWGREDFREMLLWPFDTQGGLQERQRKIFYQGP